MDQISFPQALPTLITFLISHGPCLCILRSRTKHQTNNKNKQTLASHRTLSIYKNEQSIECNEEFAYLGSVFSEVVPRQYFLRPLILEQHINTVTQSCRFSATHVYVVLSG